MENSVLYPILLGKMAERNIKKGEAAQRLHITERAFRKKISGESPFLWSEVKMLHGSFFSDIPIDELMKTKV